LTACAAPPAMPQQETPAAQTPALVEQSTPTPSPTPAPAATDASADETLMPQANLSPDMQKIAEQAAEILSKSLNVTPDAVTILSVQSVQWSNAALGCPKPGMMYAQVITPGYLVKAEVNGEIQQVHMNDRGHGIVCPPSRSKKPIHVDEASQ